MISQNKFVCIDCIYEENLEINKETALRIKDTDIVENLIEVEKHVVEIHDEAK